MLTLNSMKAIIYCRVSTEEQADSGLGLEAQLAACRGLCVREGYEVLGEFSDPGVSGKEDVDKRPGFQQVLAALRQSPGAVVVVYSVSRLTRRQSQLWRLLDDRGEYRLQLRSATEPFETTTSMGRAMLGMLGVWAQLEADMISERTKSALAAKRARGERVGAKPLTELSPRATRRIAYLWNQGFSPSQIARLLNQEHVPTVRSGRQWYETTVRNAVSQLERKNLVERKLGRVVESEGPSGDGVVGASPGSSSAEEQGRGIEDGSGVSGDPSGPSVRGAVF